MSNVVSTDEQSAEMEAIHAKKQALAAELHDGEKARHSITINKRTPEEVFSFWRDFKNLPLFMKDLAQVEILSPTLSRWTVELKNDAQLIWTAELITEKYAEMISWQSVGDSDVRQAGSVWFSEAPSNLGCVVRLHMAYTIPGGKISEIALKILGEDPNTIILTNLRRLKAYLETGEIPTTKGQASGRDEDLMPAEQH